MNPLSRFEMYNDSFFIAVNVYGYGVVQLIIDIASAHTQP